MFDTSMTAFAPYLGGIGLVIAFLIFLYVRKQPNGTDTMVETGTTLQSIAGKTIVLTGALQPALFKTSDALFNIGCGLTAAQTLASGVYIAMSGRVFECGKVQKNHRTNRFELLD